MSSELNYTAPTLETLRDIFEAYDAGEVESAQVLETIDEVTEHVNDYLDELEAQGEAGEVDPEDEGYQMILQGFEEHLIGIELLTESEDGPDEGLARVQKAVNMMVKGRRIMKAKNEVPTSVSCLFCGHENAVGSTRCGQCSRQLPVTGNQSMDQSSISVKEAVEADSEVMTQEYVKLAEAVELWKEDMSSGGQLCEALNEVGDSLERQLRANKGIARQLERFGEQVRAEGERIASRISAALDASNELLDEIYHAYDDEDDVNMDSALHNYYLQAKILVECHGDLTRLEQSVGG